MYRFGLYTGRSEQKPESKRSDQASLRHFACPKSWDRRRVTLLCHVLKLTTSGYVRGFVATATRAMTAQA